MAPPTDTNANCDATENGVPYAVRAGQVSQLFDEVVRQLGGELVSDLDNHCGSVVVS
jgi:hypothetical protein